MQAEIEMGVGGSRRSAGGGAQVNGRSGSSPGQRARVWIDLGRRDGVARGSLRHRMERKWGGAGKVLTAAGCGVAGREAAARVVRCGGGGELMNSSSG
jgi:hypothetical protein